MDRISWVLMLLCLPFVAAIVACEGDTIIEPQTSKGIQVTGVGSVFGNPDVAMLSLGIVAEEKEVEQARATAAEAMQKVTDSLKGNGVAEKDIQTQQFSIYPVYDYLDRGQQVLRGYQVNNIVSAKIRNIDKAGEIIDDAVTAGGKLIRVNSISFTIDDKKVLQDKAREEAMKDASAKAKTLAQMGGVELGKPVYISESVGVSPIYRTDYALGEGAKAVTPVEPGQIEVTVTVSVTYEIE